MKQPDLGKKIAELRRAKGLTQEELVEKCNLSVRTLQRIESGEVTPRSYTVKIIFAALDYPAYGNMTADAGNAGHGKVIYEWPGQFYTYLKELFNLKTNAMKKITILTITLIAVFFGLFALTSKSEAQKAVKVAKTIEDLQAKGNKWISEGKVDSVLTLYREDATVLPLYTGKAEIRGMLQSAVDGNYRILEFKNLSISVADSIAVQKYYDVFEFHGATIKQTGMTEWRLTRGKWLVVNDIMVNN
jgi:transcriptional regulator with XRE-family HTH domain